MERQELQAIRHQEWVSTKGALELPVQIDTYLQARQRARHNWLRTHVEGTVLEVGCSWGYVLAYVEGHAGVDINPALVVLARLLARTRQFEVGTATALPFESATFDTVMLPEVLEHLDWEQVQAAIREAVRVAKRKVLVTIPDGRYDTDDTNNGKHHWLLDERRAYDVATYLGNGVSLEYVAGFACFEKDL